MTTPRRPRPRTQHVWTDGACSRTGIGGWAWVTRSGTAEYGGELRTTNQRMEMQAALQAVQTLMKAGPVHVHSDSAYVVNCFLQRWHARWVLATEGGDERAVLRKKTRDGVVVANSDLWLELFGVDAAHKVRWSVPVRWTHLRGHAGDEMNGRADALAVEAKRRLAADVDAGLVVMLGG